jgi:hypothetical protein
LDEEVVQAFETISGKAAARREAAPESACCYRVNDPSTYLDGGSGIHIDWA